jgi:hypothetical protein
MIKFLKTQTTAPTAADLEQRLQAAQADHSRLTADHAQAAYDSLMATGEPDRVETLAVELAAASRLIGTLTAAIGVAKAREAEAARQRRIAGQAAQIGRVEAILHRRARYAEQLTDHLTAAMKVWRLLVDNSVRAGIAYPAGDAPLGTMLGPVQIKALVAAELHRLGGVPPLSADPMPSFPGAYVADHALLGTPEKIVPLADAIQAANSYAVAAMHGQAPADMPLADPVATDPVEEAEMAEAVPTVDANDYTPVRVRMS